jgi:hypothetical protein
MRKRPLQVTLEAREASTIELTVGERVQLDRLTPSPRGSIAERHGGLLEPGTTRLDLERGFYSFKTLSDANLRVVCGGVDTASTVGDKDPWPDPPPRLTPPGSLGDEAPGEQPSFTVTATSSCTP